MKKGDILSVEKIVEKRWAQGTNFNKGDFIPEIVSYVAKVVGMGLIEISREAILSVFSGRKRISGNLLDSMKGMNINQFK